MTRVSASELADQVAAAQEDKHDTLYCNPSHADKLTNTVSKGMVYGSRNIDKLLGLDVVEIPRLDRIIVCEKGEVFPLAKEYKDE